MFTGFWEKQNLVKATFTEDKVLSCCPFHQDDTPSFAAFLSNGRWACFGACNTKGTAAEFLAKKEGIPLALAEARIEKEVGAAPAPKRKPGRPAKERLIVDPTIVAAAHANLMTNHEVRARLMEMRGWTEDFMKQYLIGYSPADERIWIPIKEGEDYVDVRRYDWLHKTEAKFLPFAKGHGAVRLWPGHWEPKVVLFEGEPDCALALSWGIPAKSFTGGAGAPGTLVADEVLVLYDNDAAGRDGSDKVCHQLKRTCRTVKVGSYPDGIKDLTEWWKSGLTPEAFRDFLESQFGSKDDTEPAQVLRLDESLHESHHNTKVKVSAIASGKDLTPFQVPRRCSLTCLVGKSRGCGSCPLKSIIEERGSYEFEIPASDPILIECADETTAHVRTTLKDFLAIPHQCTACNFETLEIYNVWDVRLNAQVDVSAEAGESKYVAVRSWSTQYLELNQPYTITAKSVPDPKSQHATLLITEVATDKTSLDSFQLTPEQVTELKVFQPLGA